MNGTSFSAARRCQLITLLTAKLWYFATTFAMAGTVVDLDDIAFWAGSGSNRSALVLDWQGNSSTDLSLAWGFRWNGSATGEDQFRAIVGADPRLFAKIGSTSGLGLAVFGLGYDANNDGQFALDDGTPFDAEGFAFSQPADGASSLDPADLYAEGWLVSGFWHYGTASTSPFSGGIWSSAPGGLSARILSDGSWDSLAFTPTYSLQAFASNPWAALPAESADFDSSGTVDGRDFLLWQRGFGRTSASPVDGDANGDGQVDAVDLTIWSNQYGTGPGGLSSLSSFAGSELMSAPHVVPEPSGWICLCVAATAWSGFFVRQTSVGRNCS